VYSAINCLKRENKLKKKGKQNVKVQQGCSYIDVLSVTWLAKREGDSRCWHCAGWSVTHCQTRRVVEGIERISGREVELVVKKKN
jgi:hypothetical protein